MTKIAYGSSNPWPRKPFSSLELGEWFYEGPQEVPGHPRIKIAGEAFSSVHNGREYFITGSTLVTPIRYVEIICEI
jgi:hypothetical protein